MADETDSQEGGELQVIGLVKRVMSLKREYKITEPKGAERKAPKPAGARAEVQLNMRIMERPKPKKKKARTMSDVKV